MQTSMRSHACSRRHVGMGIAHACTHGRSRAQMHTRACCPSPHHHGRHQAVHCRQRHAAAPAVCAGVASLVLAWRLKDLRYSGFVSLEAGRESDVSTLQMGKNARGKDLASIATATQSYERGARALVAVRIQHAGNHIGEAERRSQVCELRRTLEVSGEN